MIIEFTGIPGSGKTTMARELAKTEGFEYIKTVGKGEKYRYFFYFAVCHPFRFICLYTQTFFQSIKTRSIKLFFYKMRVLTSYIARTSKALAFSKSKTVVLDEGLAHYGLSLFEERVTEAQVTSYLKKFLIADKIIFLETTESEGIKRLKNRGNIPRISIIKNWESWYTQYAYNSRIFKQAYENNKKIEFEVINVDTP